MTLWVETNHFKVQWSIKVYISWAYTLGNTLATWCEELTHWERPWRWERLKAGEEGDNRGWDGWMASLTWWTWVWASSGVGDGQRRLACCSACGHRIRHDWATQMNWSWASLMAGEESTCNSGHVGDLRLIPGSRRSLREENGNPLQYSCLEKSHGQQSLAGHSPWGCKESNMTTHTCEWS